MRKFDKVEETDDLLDELLGGMELNATVDDALEETEQNGASEDKKKKKKKKKEKESEEEKVTQETPEEIAEREEKEKEAMEMILNRIDAGLIGSLPIKNNEMNSPVFRKGDIAQLRKPNRLLIKDFIFYKMGEDYYLRRIIKFKEDDIYVAGDNEKEYHIIHKTDIIGKVIGRERGKNYSSFGFNPQHKFYTFCKVNLAPLRLGKRVKSYDEDQNKESFEAAMQNLDEKAALKPSQVENQTPVIAADIDLDTDLQDFLDPDDLVKELRGETVIDRDKDEPEETEVTEEFPEEEGEVVEYVEEGSIGDAPSEDNAESEESDENEETEESSESEADEQ